MIQSEFMNPNLRYQGYKVCEFHRGIARHSIEDCAQFRSKIQAMMDAWLIEFCENKTVNAVNEEPSFVDQAAPPAGDSARSSSNAHLLYIK